jgi:hypothetical protein
VWTYKGHVCGTYSTGNAICNGPVGIATEIDLFVSSDKKSLFYKDMFGIFLNPQHASNRRSGDIKGHPESPTER